MKKVCNSKYDRSGKNEDERIFQKVTAVVLALSSFGYLAAFAHEDIDDCYYETTGLSMTLSELQNAFMGRPEGRFMPLNLVETKLELGNISISGTDVSVEVVLTSLNTFGEKQNRRKLSINGTIYNGNREESTFIIEVPNNIEGYEVLLFEINTNPTMSNLALPQSHYESLYNTPHIKLYLLDEYGYFHLFETEIPYEFSTLNPSDFENLEHALDILWPMSFRKKSACEILDTTEFEEEIGDEFFDIYEAINYLYFHGLDADISHLLPEGVTFHYVLPNKNEDPDYQSIESASTQLTNLNRWFTWTGATRTATTYWMGAREVVSVRPHYVLEINNQVRVGGTPWVSQLAIEQWSRRYNATTGAFMGENISPGYFRFQNWDLQLSVGLRTRFRRMDISGAPRRREMLSLRDIILTTAHHLGGRFYSSINSRAWNLPDTGLRLFRNAEVVQRQPVLGLPENPRTIYYRAPNNYFMSVSAPARYIGGRGIASGDFVGIIGYAANTRTDDVIETGRTGRARVAFSIYNYRGQRQAGRTMNRHWYYTLRP